MATDPAKYAPKPWAEAETSGLQLAAGVVIGGKYTLLRPAGFGGMGAVWVAKNQATGADVAVKVLLAEEAASKEAAARFRREAHAAARLSHRGIVRIFDLVELEGEHEGALVMVMELLRGETLADVFDKRPKLDVAETMDIALPLLSALNHAHNAGIIHRDLKPENVFLSVDPDGHLTPKILDFGISKLSSPEAPRITGDGALLGTPSYMSPEQARGSHDVERTSDIFTMGILLYEMLSGKNPFASGSYHSVVAAILERKPEPLMTIPLPLWDVIAKALKKAPEERYQTAAELATALREATGMGAMHVSNPPALSVPSISVTPSPADLEAPSRKFQPTVLNVRVANRKQWVTRIVGVLVGVGLGLAFLGVLLARNVLSHPGVAPSNDITAVTPKPTVPAPEGPKDAPAVASPAVASPSAVAASNEVVPTASTTAAQPIASSRPQAPSGKPSRGRKLLRGTGKPGPQDAPAATPSPPEPKPSTVVRDPGF